MFVNLVKRTYTLIIILILAVTGTAYWACWKVLQAETTVRYAGLQSVVATQLEKTLKGMEMSAANVFIAVENHLDSPEAVIDALKSEASLNPDVRGYFAAFEPNYFKEKGTWFEPYVHHSGDRKYQLTMVGSESHDYTQSPWYISAKKTQKAFWSDPYYYYDGTDISGRYTTYVTPVFDEKGQLACVCGADITFDWLGKELDRINDWCRNASMINEHLLMRDFKFFTALVNQEGVCIWSPGEKYVPVDDSRVLSDIKEGKCGTMHMIVDGEPSTLYYGPIEGIEWSLFIVVPTFDLQKPFLYIGIAMALLAVMGILGAWLILKRKYEDEKRR